MPTKNELAYLLKDSGYCDMTWEPSMSSEGVRHMVCRFTGKGDYAANSIFLPIAGIYRFVNPRDDSEKIGYYWSADTPLEEEDDEYEDDAWCLMLSNGFYSPGVREGFMDVYGRVNGMSVRAVRDMPDVRDMIEELIFTFTVESALMPPEGSEGNPWEIGATDASSVTAYTNGTGKLIIEGVGAVASTPWVAGADGITGLVKGEDVTGFGDIVATLPALKSVNGLKIAELNGLAVGAVKTAGFNAIAVENGMATLSFIIYKAESLVEPEWKGVVTNEVSIKADTPTGFFIVAPDVPSLK